MLYYVVNGLVLGLTAGMTPGPLMALIITESLQGGWPAGFRVAIAPLVTDSALVTLALLVAAPMPTWGLKAINVIGGGIIIWMGVGTLRAGAPVAAEVAGSGGSMMRGIVTNLLNPAAFLFWLTVGGPLFLEGYRTMGWTGPLSFMAPFFVVMILINMIIAFACNRGRHFLEGAAYRWTLRVAGLLLAGLGAWRMVKGLGLM